MKIEFTNLGRGKWCGVIEIPNNTNAETIVTLVHREVKKHLMSKYPDVEYDENTKKGIITAGFYQVGSFEVSNDQ